MSLNVRPNKILQAANWLAANSILYREQGISLKFSTDRATSYSTNLSQNESKTGDVSQPNEQISGSEDINQLDDWTEDDEEIPAGVTDTMLTAIDFLEDNERAQIYNRAPGEGNVPLSYYNIMSKGNFLA